MHNMCCFLKMQIFLDLLVTSYTCPRPPPVIFLFQHCFFLQRLSRKKFSEHPLWEGMGRIPAHTIFWTNELIIHLSLIQNKLIVKFAKHMIVYAFLTGLFYIFKCILFSQRKQLNQLVKRINVNRYLSYILESIGNCMTDWLYLFILQTRGRRPSLTFSKGQLLPRTEPLSEITAVSCPLIFFKYMP